MKIILVDFQSKIYENRWEESADFEVALHPNSGSEQTCPTWAN